GPPALRLPECLPCQESPLRMNWQVHRKALVAYRFVESLPYPVRPYDQRWCWLLPDRESRRWSSTRVCVVATAARDASVRVVLHQGWTTARQAAAPGVRWQWSGRGRPAVVGRPKA